MSSDEPRDYFYGGGLGSLFSSFGRAIGTATSAASRGATAAATIGRTSAAAARQGATAASVSRATATTARQTAASTASKTTQAQTAAATRAAQSSKAAANAAADVGAAPTTLGSRLMNTASGLGNFGVLGANIAAPIYMTVDAAQQSKKADEARRQAEADAERAYKEMQEDRAKGDKLNKEMSDAAKAQEDMYLAALGVFNQNQNRQDGTMTIDNRPITQEEADILDILGTIAAPPIEPPPPPTSTPNTYVPLPPAPPAPPAVVPVQTTVPPTVLPPPPPPPPSSGPTVRGVRGRGRSCRGGMTHADHKQDILRLLRAYK